MEVNYTTKYPLGLADLEAGVVYESDAELTDSQYGPWLQTDEAALVSVATGYLQRNDDIPDGTRFRALEAQLEVTE